MTRDPWFAAPQDDVAALANLVGRLAFLTQHVIGEGHVAEIQREADEIRDRLNENANSHSRSDESRATEREATTPAREKD